MNLKLYKESVNKLTDGLKQDVMKMIECGKLADLGHILDTTLQTQPIDSVEYKCAIADMMSLFNITEDDAKEKHTDIKNNLVKQYVSCLYEILLSIKPYTKKISDINTEMLVHLNDVLKDNTISVESITEKEICFYQRGWIVDFIDTVKNGISISDMLLQAGTCSLSSSDSNVAFESYNTQFETLDSSVQSFVFKSIKQEPVTNLSSELGWSSYEELLLLKDNILTLNKAFEQFVIETEEGDLFNIAKLTENAYINAYAETRPLPSRYMNTTMCILNNLYDTIAKIPLDYIAMITSMNTDKR